MKKLNHPQEEVYRFICGFYDSHGYPPTVREICAGVGLSSPATVHTHLKNLESKDLIRRDPNKHGYSVVRKSSGADAVPLLGNVAAGLPIMAVENVEDAFPVPDLLLKGGDTENAFMLHVHGDSMINAGIRDADILVVSAQVPCFEGDIVVARIDGAEFTVKRLFKHEKQIELRAENEAYAPLYLDPCRVEIAGKVTGLMRSF